jgi:UDP-N-acetylglucosamine 1-carboxyvinyltransferase
MRVVVRDRRPHNGAQNLAEFIVEGGAKLNGEIVASGNKNAALPLLAASLLTTEPVTLRNMPRIRDVLTLIELLSVLGAKVEWIEANAVRVDASGVSACAIDPSLSREIRASILLAGPMLARCGSVSLPPPGGDVIGRRRLDTHFLAFEALGAAVTIDATVYSLERDELVGADIMLDEASVTATENAIMAASLARGVTVLRNAASEPHVQDLCHMLVSMGSTIDGIGTNTLTIHGVKALRGTDFTVGADNVEVTSWIVIGALCGGDQGLLVRNASPQHLPMTRIMLNKLGVRFDARGGDVFVPGRQELVVTPDLGGAVPKIDDGIWPAYPADSMSPTIVAATQARGTVLIFEKMYESRLFFVDKLIAMGAQIILCDPHRCVVVGPTRLRGERVQSPDIRAGLALVIAALCAEGRSVISNVQQIDRGYEGFADKLRRLGANITRSE